MIDVGGAALLGAAARNAAGVAVGRRPGPLPAGHRRAARARRGQPGDAGQARGRGVQHGRRLPRRDRRLPQPDLGQHLPAPPRARPREGRRPALRREPAPARGVLPRDDAPQRHARRRDPAAGRHAVVQQPARPRRRVPDRPRLHGADGRHRQAHRPGRAGVARRARRGLPARARDRPGRLVRRHRRGQPRARRRDRARDRGQLVRGGRRARLQPVGARHPARQARARAAGDPARPDRGHARLRHRQPRLQARRRRPARREPSTTSGSTAAGSRS